MSWWCRVTSVFCGYQKTIIKLIFPLASVFCWLSNVTLWCIDNGMDGGFLILRLGENLRESLLQDDDIWWVENWDGSYVSQRLPPVPWWLFTKEKNGNVITMGESELWVNIMMACTLPRDRWPPEEFDLKYFWWSKLFLWIKFCHISWLGMRQWGTGAPWHWDDQWLDGLDWLHPGMSFYKPCDNFNLHCYSFNFSTCYDDLKLCKVTQLKPSFPFWQQSYLMEETRFWQVYRKIFFMPWLRETNYGCSLSVMGCLIRNRLWVWEETTGIWARHGGSNRKKWAPQKGNVPLRW